MTSGKGWLVWIAGFTFLMTLQRAAARTWGEMPTIVVSFCLVFVMMLVMRYGFGISWNRLLWGRD